MKLDCRINKAVDKQDRKFQKKTQHQGGASRETICFYYKEEGHWKRNFLKYLEDKKNKSSSKGIKVIQVNVIDILLSKNYMSWLFDTGLVANICNMMQGLRNVQKLSRNEVVM